MGWYTISILDEKKAPPFFHQVNYSLEKLFLCRLIFHIFTFSQNILFNPILVSNEMYFLVDGKLLSVIFLISK